MTHRITSAVLPYNAPRPPVDRFLRLLHGIRVWVGGSARAGGLVTIVIKLSSAPAKQAHTHAHARTQSAAAFYCYREWPAPRGVISDVTMTSRAPTSNVTVWSSAISHHRQICRHVLKRMQRTWAVALVMSCRKISD